MRLVSPIYFFSHFLNSIIYVRLVELQVIIMLFYLSCFAGAAKSVRISCIVNVRAGETSMSGVAAESARGEFGVVLVFFSFARTKRSLLYTFLLYTFIFLLSHITSTLSSCHVLANHFFPCIFSNFNLRSRYYIFLQHSSGPEVPEED